MQIYEILKQEHEEVKALLNDLVALKKDDEYRFVLVEEIKAALLPHSRAEEATLYNTIRSVDADKSLVAHGYQEHMEAESLLRLLEVKDKINFDWHETAVKLRDALNHHVEEEEGKIFTEAQSIFSAEEAEAIGEAYLSIKPNFAGNGVMKSAVDLVVNMLPPRLADSIRGSDSSKI